MDKYGQMSKWNVTMGIFSVGVLVILSFIPWAIGEDQVIWFVLALILYSLIWIVTIIALWHIPLETSVSNSEFRINFPLRKKTIPISELKSADVYTRSKSFASKIGSRFYFGWWGKYHDDNIGPVYVYASNLDELVLVKLIDDRKLIVSCSDARTMADSINKRIGRIRPNQFK